MAIVVRDADLDRDRSEIIRVLREYLTEHSDDKRYDWLYLQNPNGRARAWIASDDSDGRTVGVAGAFPRTMFRDGAAGPGYVLGDFCVSTDARSLGPALALQRACLKGIAAENAAWFDLPSDTMVAIYRRLGFKSAGSIMRYAKLIRLDEKVRSRVPYPVLATGISTVGNLALRLQARRAAVSAEVAIGVHDARFGDEFTRLNTEAAALAPVYASRSAEYLNWRYRDNPMRQYLTVTARRKGELTGYAVVAVDGSEWRIGDLIGFADDSASAGILAHLEDLARRGGAEKLTALAMEQSAAGAALKRGGFSPREGHPVIVSAGSADHWFLMDGDRES